MPRLDLYPLAKDAPREAHADATVIVVDMLRASTTIATALAAGAECVMPFAEIDETLAAAQRFGRDQVPAAASYSRRPTGPGRSNPAAKRAAPSLGPQSMHQRSPAQSNSTPTLPCSAPAPTACSPWKT